MPSDSDQPSPHDLLRHARERAPTDVRETLDWLELAGFSLIHAVGHPLRTFGNVALRYDRSATWVVIVRDRGQWSVDIGPAGGPLLGLHILNTARTGELPLEWPGADLPTQIPAGVVWATDVPATVEWLTSRDRSDDIEDARQAWRALMDGRLAPPDP